MGPLSAPWAVLWRAGVTVRGRGLSEIDVISLYPLLTVKLRGTGAVQRASSVISSE